MRMRTRLASTGQQSARMPSNVYDSTPDADALYPQYCRGAGSLCTRTMNTTLACCTVLGLHCHSSSGFLIPIPVKDRSTSCRHEESLHSGSLDADMQRLVWGRSIWQHVKLFHILYQQNWKTDTGRQGLISEREQRITHPNFITKPRCNKDAGKSHAHWKDSCPGIRFWAPSLHPMQMISVFEPIWLA